MQFITLDQRIAVENFEVGVVYTVAFTSGDSFIGSCMGIGADFVAFQRSAPEYIFCLTMTTAADIAGIDPLGDDIGKILEYTGSVPVSIKTDGSPLLAYTIKGNSIPGTGTRTANLLSEKYENRSINGAGAFSIDSNYDLWIGEVVAGQIYTISNMDYVYGFFTAKPLLNTGVTYDGSRGIEPSGTAVVTVPSGCTWIAVRVLHNADNAMLNEGSTALPFEPYGYKIPVISGGTTTNIYLDTPLRKSLDGTATDELSSNGKLTRRVDTDGSVLATTNITYIDTPTIPTTDGLDIFDIDTTVKPSEVYLKYFSPLF